MLGSSRRSVLQGVEIRTHEAAKRAASELTAILGQKVTVGTSVDTLDNNQICLLYKCCSCLYQGSIGKQILLCLCFITTVKPRILKPYNVVLLNLFLSKAEKHSDTKY